MNLKNALENHNVSNILGYIRKSRQDIEREKRTGEDTLAEQTKLMNNVLMSIELPYELKSEIGSGESIDGRPVFQECLKDLENGKYQAIAVKELARLSRGSYSDAGRIIELITEKRIPIITPYKVFDPRNVMDMKQIRFELFLAREEYELIRERLTGARYTYAAQGKWVAGKAPYGYRYNKNTRNLEINEEQAKVIIMIYDLFLYGLNGVDMSYTAIATHLTKMGIPTPRGKKAWSYFYVKRVLENDLYIGTIRFRTHERNKKGQRIPRPENEHIVVEDAHPAIIEKGKFEKVQTKIKNKPIAPHNPLDFDPCELASVCTCSVCGGKLVRNCGKHRYKKKDGSESIYIKEFLKCQKERCMSVKYRDVEEAILEVLKNIESMDEDQLKIFFEAQINEQKNADGSQTQERMLQQIEQKEKELKSRESFIFEKFEQGIYTDEIFLQRKAVIDKEREELKKAKSELEQAPVLTKNESIPTIKENMKTFREAYMEQTEKTIKNEYLRTIFDHVEIEIIEKGRGTRPSKFRIVPYFKYKALTNKNLRTLVK
ncbi:MULTISPECIES: recombinase family protein [Bacillus]|uniref:Recombinase family protein n=1 Tax=Bacillus glycinifermentans TaxID=1664069 RepID=A0AAJ4D2R3_9BACI|nr:MULTISPECIES: recombinase family protein [Bacillus]KKB72049.1 resolvase [Bacillus sp. TH008]MDU0072007.1 recombinase family protein [Bacillus sp. IG6]MED8019735.1 recombinase family protein [Bacillus glycinifermentans]QAT65172.1 recombinase family protein [Bacillus glycinifermentans]WKB79146.1 recombinase family protein [Bacillus glycinifermentans]